MSAENSESIDNKGESQPRAAVVVDPGEFVPLFSTPPLSTYIGTIIARRHFILADARSRAFQGNRGTFLGKFWLVFNPLIDAATYGFVFGFLLKTSRGMDNFVGFLIIGVTFFGFLSSGLNSCSGLIQSSRAIVQAFRFPKASLVIGRTLRAFWDNLLPAIVSILVALAFQPGKIFSWTILLTIPLYVLLHIFICGLSFFVARLTAQVPDFKALIRLFSRIWFYVSGVFFSVSRYADLPLVGSIMTANPGYRFLEMLRAVVIDQRVPPLNDWINVTAWALGLFILGFVFFWKAEEKYIDV